MAVDIVMPQMGESIFEGTITKWLKKPGDKVERDEPLFEISTDKVDAEIPSPSAGILKEIKVAEGKTVPIQTVVGVIEAAGAASAAQPAAPAASSAVAPQTLPADASPGYSGWRCYPCCFGGNGSGLQCYTSQGRRTHSQFAAGAAHGQGTCDRSDRCRGNGLGRTNQQAGYRSVDCGRRPGDRRPGWRKKQSSGRQQRN